MLRGAEKGRLLNGQFSANDFTHGPVCTLQTELTAAVCMSLCLSLAVPLACPQWFGIDWLQHVERQHQEQTGKENHTQD